MEIRTPDAGGAEAVWRLRAGGEGLFGGRCAGA